MSPAAIGPVKSMILGLDLAEMQDFVAQLLDANDGAPSIREKLRDFALSRGVPV
jgi:phosphotransferase system, enzyme I, PtsP